MRLSNWMRAMAVLMLMTAGMAVANAAKPVILAPAAGGEVRGDGADGKNLIRWSIPTPPNFLYTLAITPLDPTTQLPLAAPVTFPFAPTDPTITAEGTDAYRRPFDFNRNELQQFGTGLFAVTLRATDFSFDDTSDPVMYYKGRPIAAITGIDAHNPDAIQFGMALDDPDSTPDYLYSVTFQKMIDGVTTGTPVGPYTSTASALGRTRADFTTFHETDLEQGQDYMMKLQVSDTQPANPADPGLTSFPTTATFHLNAKPRVLSLTGPGGNLTSFTPAPNNDPTYVTYNVLATDLDNSTVTLTIQISLRDDATFATGAAFTTAVTTVITRDQTAPIAVPIPFTGPYWTVRAFVTDPLGIRSNEMPSLNLTIDDYPTVDDIAPTYASNGAQPAANNRFDFDLISIEQPVGPNSGVVNAPIHFEAVNVQNTFRGPLSYQWDFGDGASSTEVSPSHTYTHAASRTITLVITDAQGFQVVKRISITINDRPKLEITGVSPGTKDSQTGDLLTQLNSPSGAQVDILWQRYNFVHDGNEDFGFQWGRTGTTIVDDRRGVANVETPTPGNLYFLPGDTPKAVPDQGGVTSTINVPTGERLGPITNVKVHALDLVQTFDDPATDTAANAPATQPGVIPVNLTGATDDGIAPIDTAAAGAPSDVASAAPLAAPGSFAIDTSAATADGVASVDAADAAETDTASSAPLVAPGTFPIDTTLATADSIAQCDWFQVPAAETPTGAPLMSPGTYHVDTASAMGDGIASCDFAVVAPVDLASGAWPLSPGTQTVNVSAATADGLSSCDILSATATDLFGSAPQVAPGTYAISTSGAFGEGASTSDPAATVAADASTGASLIWPGSFSIDLSSATADGTSTADPMLAVGGSDASASATVIGPGTSSVDLTAATADGAATCDVVVTSATDSAASAPLINPGTYAVSTVGATNDGVSNADPNSATPSDAAASAPAIWPAGRLVDTSGATADGISPVELSLSATASDAAAGAPLIGPGAYSFSVSGASADGASNCDVTTATAADDGSAAPLIEPGSYWADLAAATADGITTCDLASVAPSDTAAGALAIAPGTQTGNIDTDGSTLDGSSTSDDSGTTYTDVFYLYTPQATGVLNLTLDGTTTAGVVSVHTATPATSATQVASAISTGTSETQLLNIAVTAGTSYWIRVALQTGSGAYLLAVDGPNTRRDVWYKYTPMADGTVDAMLTSSPLGAVLSVHTAWPATMANAVACSATTTNDAAISFAATSGDSYWIRVAGAADGSTTSMGLALAGPGARRDVWYRYTPRANGTLTASLSGSASDSVLSVHSAAPGTVGNALGCAMTIGSNPAVVSMPVTAGTTYWIRAAGPKDGSQPSFGLNLAGPNIRKDVYFSYTPRTSGQLDFSLLGSPDDAVISIHSAAPATSGNALASDITTSSHQASIPNFAVTANTTYLLRIAGAADATTETFQVNAFGPGTRRDVYYAYKPEANGTATFTLSDATADAVLSLHSGAPVSIGNELDSTRVTTTGASLSLAVTAGSTYYVRVAEPMDGSDQAFTLDVAGPGARRDVWYAYTPRADGMLTATLASSADGAVLSAHSAAPGTAANEIACARTAGSTQGSVNFAVTANTTYYLRAAGPLDNATPTFNLSVSGPEIRKDVYYEYLPRANGTLHLTTTGAPAGAIVSVHSASPATAGNTVAVATVTGSQAAFDVPVTAGTSYLIRVAGDPGATTQAFTLGATGPATRRDVYLAYKPQAAGAASVSLSGATADTVISVHTAGPGSAGDQVASAVATGSTVSANWTASAGTIYYIRIAEPKDGSDQAFSLTLAGPGVRRDVWYTYTPRADGPTTVSLAGSPADAVLSVHTAAPGTIANALDCAMTSGSQQAEIGFNGVAGTTYWIRAAGPRDDSLDQFQLELAGPPARKDVYYTYIPRASGTANIALAGSPDGAVLSIHSAGPATVANELACAQTQSGNQAGVTLAVTEGTTYTVRVAGSLEATSEAFDVTLDGPNSRKDVWLKYIPRASGTATLSLAGSPDDAVLSVHSAAPGTVANTVACDRTSGTQQATIASLAVTADTPYYIRIAGPKDLSDGTFDLNLAGPGVRRDVWYRYTPVTSGAASFTLTGSTPDAVLSVHSAAPGTAANQLGAQRAGAGNVATVSLNVTAGQDYYIRAAGPKDVANQTFTLAIAGPNTRSDVWLLYTPGSYGSATFALSGSSAGSIVSVHTAAPGTVANAIGGAATVGSIQASVNVTATTFSTLLVRVAVPWGGTLTPTLNLSGPPAAEWIGDLQVFLMSPTGTQIKLFDGLCRLPNPSEGPFDLTDAAASAIVNACPITSGSVYQPEEALTAFNGQSPTGNWTLTVNDATGKNVGRLAGWALQISTEEIVPAQNDSVSNADVSSFLASGSIPNLFRVPGTYQFSLNGPTEHFGSDGVTGQGDTATILVKPQGGLKNAADTWMLYR